MTLAEIVETADVAIAQQASLGGDPSTAHVLLKLARRGRWGRRTNVRLLGRGGGPLGRIVSDAIDAEGTLLVDFPAAEIRAFALAAIERLRGRSGRRSPRA